MELLEGIPKVLFKYRDWENEHHRDIVQKNELYFSSMSQFNVSIRPATYFANGRIRLSSPAKNQC